MFNYFCTIFSMALFSWCSFDNGSGKDFLFHSLQSLIIIPLGFPSHSLAKKKGGGEGRKEKENIYLQGEQLAHPLP